MAYSRWINSDFYTYWLSGQQEQGKEKQVFMVHPDLTNNVEITFPEAKKILEDPSLLFDNEELQITSTADALELCGYIEEWFEDLDSEYGEE